MFFLNSLAHSLASSKGRGTMATEFRSSTRQRCGTWEKPNKSGGAASEGDKDMWENSGCVRGLQSERRRLFSGAFGVGAQHFEEKEGSGPVFGVEFLVSTQGLAHLNAWGGGVGVVGAWGGVIPLKRLKCRLPSFPCKGTEDKA